MINLSFLRAEMKNILFLAKREGIIQNRNILDKDVGGIHFDCVVIDSFNDIEKALRYNCKIYLITDKYVTGLPENVSVVKPIYVDKHEQESPLSKKANCVYNGKDFSINECSVYVNSNPDVSIDYDMIHAMGCGTICFSVDCPFTNYLKDNTLFVPIDESFSENLDKIFKDPKYLFNYRVFAMKYYLSNFTNKAYDEKWQRIFNEC